MRRKVVGQDQAIEKVVEIYQMFLAGLNPPGRPVGNLLFLGPTDSGKTRVVEAIAQALFGNTRSCIKIDCAEFQHSHEIAKLIGSPPGYLGHRETHPVLTQEALVGCAICHVATYKTLPAGTRIYGGTYKVPKFIGNTVIHPYSDFLLHDVGTGDGIRQAAKTQYLDQSTANKFRSPRLWGLRFRYGLMHDGNSTGSQQAIMRHGGEARRSASATSA
jgi:hypothetical protein